MNFSWWMAEKVFDGVPHWASVETLEDDIGIVQWTTDADKATHFNTRFEAERVAKQIDHCIATEHEWAEMVQYGKPYV